ncbi:hypothetical protein ACQPYH_02485 [Kribbella sp. CA-245084]|uniref:hypothetical protein n=1 Tax=Kribbella sp. CA-245084 TaxID=3239940 RepID=UPI003D8B2DAC
MAATKSGLVLPENRWLVREPSPDVQARGTMGYTEFVSPVGHWELRSGLKVEATAGALLSIDFSAMSDAMVRERVESGRYFPAVIEAVKKRVQIINALALCLHSATVEEANITYGGFRVTHQDLVHFSESDSGMSWSGPNLPTVPGHGFVIRHRNGVCSDSMIAAACNLLDDVLLNEHEKVLDLVVLMNHALVACKGHDFDLAVATAWTVCESLIDSWWREYAETQASRLSLSVDRKRRDLWAGRDFTASIIVETMTLAGVIPADLSKVIGEVRGKRNKWIHGVAAPTYEDAVKAVTLTHDLLEKVVGLNIRLAPSIGVSGI